MLEVSRIMGNSAERKARCTLVEEFILQATIEKGVVQHKRRKFGDILGNGAA
jgi:hypothetical protein